MVQTSANPLRFLLICHRPALIGQSYLGDIKNKRRRSLGFDQVPVLMEVRQSRKNWEEREEW
jgi:GTP-binding protein